MKIYRLNRNEFRSWRDREKREQLKRRLFDALGATQLRGPGGRVLGTARSSSARIPVEGTIFRAAHHAIPPGECVCREWQKPAGQEAEHHQICMHRAAWEAQRERDPDAARPRAMFTEQKVESVVSVDEQLPAEVATKVVNPAAALPPSRGQTAPETNEGGSSPEGMRTSLAPLTAPEPEACVCREWTTSVPGQHHQLCRFRALWERDHGVRAPELVELETGEVAREANADEVVASELKRAEDGVGAIELTDGRLYYVRQP